MVIPFGPRNCHLSFEQWDDTFLDTSWPGILSRKTGVGLYRSSTLALIPYKALLLDQLTCFQQRHICLRSRHSLKASQRQPSDCVVSRRLWKSFSWIFNGWRRTLNPWWSGYSMFRCTSQCHPFGELHNLGSAAFCKREKKMLPCEA